MRQWKVVLAALLVGSVMIGMSSLAVQAQVRPPWPVHQHGDAFYQYSVKVVQGEMLKPEVLGPGQYSTSVNIHNPWCHDVHYQVKLAVSGTNGKEDTITLFQSYTLTPDGATEFDRAGFATLMFPVLLPGFVEGYFVIECEEELDVVAVYSGNALGSSELSTMETERVPARRVPRGQDLGVYISTGVAVPAWQTSGTAAPILFAPCSGWVTPNLAGVLWNAQWVGTTNCVATAGGDYMYTYTFNLSCNFYSAEIHFRLWADNSATVRLNDVPVPGLAMDNWVGPPAALPLAVDIYQGFIVGQNKLEIVVHNRNSSSGAYTNSGMMLDGWLFAEAGI